MKSEKLTAKMPLVLTVIMILLIVVRTAVWISQVANPKEPDGIKWQEPTRADLAGGRDYQKKAVFYYFCDEDSEACRKVSAGALLNKHVVKIVNEKFLPIKVLSSPGADISKELQRKFGLTMSPSFVVALPNGNEVGVLGSYFGVSAKTLLSFIHHCELREQYVAGLSYLGHDQYMLAADSLESWLQGQQKIDAQVIDGALFCAVAEKMLFKEKAVQQIMDKIKNSQYDVDSNWPKPLEQFLLGDINADQLMGSCDNRDSRLSQALYCAGMLEVRNGNFEGAYGYFKQADKINDVVPEIRMLIFSQLSMMGAKRD